MKKFSILLLSLVVLSCNNNQGPLYDRIDKKYHNGDTVIMQDITPFDWDTMYIFDGGCNQEYINIIIGFNYPFYTDIADRIIFTRNKKVTYHEDNFPNPSPSKGDKKLSFYFQNDTIRHIFFSKENAIFTIKKERNKDVSYISLMPIDARLQ